MARTASAGPWTAWASPPPGATSTTPPPWTCPPADSKPRFTFSANWLPVEPGGDRQVLARRWMANRAAIRLLDQPGPGTVWMKILVPPSDLPDAQLILDKGATAPSVMVTASCGTNGANDAGGGSETNLTGQGVHEVELPLDAPPAGGFCRVLLSSNFLLEPAAPDPRNRKRSVSLESIAWAPGVPAAP